MKNKSTKPTLFYIISAVILTLFCAGLLGCAKEEAQLPPLPTATPIDHMEEASESLVEDAESADDSSDTNTEDATAEAMDAASLEATDSVTTKKEMRKVKGIYVTGPMAGSANIDNLIELCKTTELNTMVIDVKNDEGSITYRMDIPQEADFDQSVRYISDLPELLKKLHDNDIYAIARIVCFKDPKLAEANPETALKSPAGKAVTDANGIAWVNPYKKEVWEYICTIAECASRDGFDEIQFDYVRFPIGSDADAADYGVDMESYTKEDGLTDFFTYASDRLHQSNIVVGADLFGTIIGSEPDRKSTGQNYASIAEKVDAICPMVYPSHYANGTFQLDVPDAHPYDTIAGAMELSHEELDATSTQKGAVRPWLQCFNAVWVDGHITYGSNEIKEQIQAVYDAGYDEWILWNASNKYDQVKDALNNR